METRTPLRGFFARVALAALIAAPVSVLPGLTATHAAGATALITEINWAGSGLSGTGAKPGDQWIELYNPVGAGERDLSTDPLLLVLHTDDSSVYDECVLSTTKSTLWAEDSYMLVRNSTAAADSNVFAFSKFIDYSTSCGLPNLTAAEDYTYTLIDDNTATVLDTTEPEMGNNVPFAGRAATPTQAPASMSRVMFYDGTGFVYASQGNLQSSWQTSNVHGVNLYNKEAVYATPAGSNLETKPITVNPVSPSGSLTNPESVTISGNGVGSTKSTQTSDIWVSYLRQSYTSFSKVSTNAHIHGSEYAAYLDLLAGRYQFTVQAETPSGALADSLQVYATGELTEKNYLVFAKTSTVPTPVLDSVQTPTNQSSVVLRGMVEDGVEWLDVARNGEYYGTYPVTDGKFEFSVNLLQNAANEFAVVANSPVSNLTEMYAASVPAIITVTSDTIAPLVHKDKLQLTANTPGNNDTLSGMAGAIEAPAFVTLFADLAHTIKVAGPIEVAADGSFAAQSIGDNLYATIYLVASDSAGNMSDSIAVTNPVAFVPVNGLQNLAVTDIQLSSIQVTWGQAQGAVNYKVRYRTGAGTFTSPVSVCAVNAISCATEVKLIGLASDTDYIISVAAVDQYGNISAFHEVGARTLAPTPVVVDTAVATPQTEAVVNTAVSTRTLKPVASPVVTPTPSPTASATPENGEVKSASTETTGTTPWMFLGLLIVILVLATLGYFYWFGGASGEAALLAAKEKVEEEKKTPPKPKSGKW